MKKLLKLTLLLLASIVLAVPLRATDNPVTLVPTFGAAAQGSNDKSYLPSNFGDWTNLSASVNDLTVTSSDPLPMQSCVSGNTLHVTWFDFNPNADGKYCVYYRRSVDQGRTWEAARAVVSSDNLLTSGGSLGSGYGNNSKWMAVEGQKVYIVTVNDVDRTHGQLVLTYSSDGGKTFQQRIIDENSSYTYVRPHVQCDGQMVVIAVECGARNGSTGNPHVFTSLDGGATFTDKLIDTEQKLVDLQVSGRRWAILGNDMYWYYNMHWGNVYLTTSADAGQTVTTQNIAPLVLDSTSWCELNYMKGWNGNAFNYHPQMTLDGNVINVIFRGCAEALEDTSPTNDRNHTIFRRSTDFGVTWTDAKYIPGTNGSQGAIAAKGQHIYVLQAPNNNIYMYHSHDGGQTWEMQTRGTWNRSTSNYFYELYIAPDDPTGQHVYMTGVRGLLVESRDGFRTVHRNFVIGTESWHHKNSNNHALTVLVDQEGTEHWLMNYSPSSVKSYTFWSIVHRRNDLLPAMGNTNMALDISEIEGQAVDMPLTNVIISMTPSIMETRDATTVECWVRVDEGTGLQISGLSNDDPNTSGSIYNGGWYIGINSDGYDWYSVQGSVSTEHSVDGKGKLIWDRWRLQIKDWGMWHHVALTYDSNEEKDNIRLYMDGLLIGVNTEHGPLRIGSNPIVIGRANMNYEPKALVDNFAIYSRALTQEEIREHIYNMPDASDPDCRLLLTFDGSLQDKSQYHNDPAPLLDALLVDHDGIRPPHPEFTVSQDLSGKNVYLNDMTQDGECYWWILPDPSNLDRIDKYSTKQTPHVEQYVSGHPGTYRYDMVARGTGDCNAYATASSQPLIIGGLKRVYPESAAQADGVSLRIEGGYRLTYSNKPRVALHGASDDIEGVWLVQRGYDSNNIFSPEDLAPARFNLSGVPTGKYDVIVGTDTLFQAFTVEPGGEPEVWADVNGNEKMLWGKYQKFTINYGNRSNTPAFNVPFIIGIPSMHGNVDVAFDFDISEICPDLDEDAQAMAMQATDYMMIYDAERGDSIRCYMLLIPYIAPNSTEAKTFRIRYNRPTGNSYSNEVEMYFMIQEPWGAEFTEGGYARAPQRLYTMEQMECMAMKFGQQLLEDGVIGQIPGIGCLYNAGKTVIQGGIDLYNRNSDGWANFGKNFVSSALGCGADLTGVGAVGQGLFVIGNMCWSALNAYWNREDCLKGPGNKKKSSAVGSYDPNEMIGPLGADENAHYIQPMGAMPYTITFENKSTATAPANEVWITDTLDLTKLDASTFCFTDFGWDNQDFTVGGQNTKNFTQNLPYTVNGQEIQVRVSGQFDPEAGVVYWSFVSLQKNGNELEDIMLGFLAPNNENHVGEGYVSFTINHKEDPANGSTVSNEATIVFDANEAIKTNTFVNTFDTDFPTSEIVNVTERNGGLDVTIAGSDGTSGIDHYDLLVFLNGTDDFIVVNNQKQNVIHVPYMAGVMKYGLCVMGTDRVGWHDRKNLTPEVNYNTGLWGDVNLDLEVNIADVNAVIDVILSGDSGVLYDVNYDGEINIADINTILDIILQ